MPFKPGYRRYRIRDVDGIDDYASIHEVVARRFKRLADDERAFPDVLLIDGGKGQLSNGLAAFALGMPPSSISFFQNKGKAKLLASTQIHVLDNEANAVRIGQRVPIQTASLPSYTPLANTNNAGRANNLNQNDLSLGLNNAFGYGVPQIQYESVGLNIDITPNVYEDDVQMKLKIETSSLDSSTGKLTPSFNQRTMTSVARVKDGQTTLVAGVSQNVESRTIKGIPLIGLIPILGRFFSTPETAPKGRYLGGPVTWGGFDEERVAALGLNYEVL